MIRFFNKFTKIEKVLILILVGLVFFSGLKIVLIFFEKEGEDIPSYGGLYSEGFLGEPNIINPLYSNLNPIDRDVCSIIFRGLMKYENGEIIDDIATHTLSADKKTYIFTIKQGIKWHDGKDLTAEDVYFTYHDILQSDEFDNEIIKEGLKDVKIEKIGNDKIQFTLKKSYKFFISNLLTGIVPKHALSGIPIKNLPLSEFNFENPIGLGPYKFKSIENYGEFGKIILSRNENFYGEKPYIDMVEFSFYKNQTQFNKESQLLLGTRPSQIKIENSNRTNYEINLNRYVALFFNTDSLFINNEKTRLGIMLGIDKTKISNIIKEKNIIDTPLLEIKKNKWIYNYDQNKAQGALHESGWKKSEKVVIEKEMQKDSIVRGKYITSHSGGIIATLNNDFYVEGNLPINTATVLINNYALKRYIPGTTTFSFKASTKIGTLKEGENDFSLKIIDNSGNEKELDKIKIFLAKNEEELTKFNAIVQELKNKEKLALEKKDEEYKNKINKVKGSEFRINEKGDILSLSLITDKNIENYVKIAEEIKSQLKIIGVDVKIEALEKNALEEAISNRKYDLLIYGQTLGYNLDVYSYWHSSQAGNMLNFSNLKNTKIDNLIEKIRSSHNENERSENLIELEKEFEKVIPAIFLYYPTYYYSIDSKIKGIQFNKIPNLQDRFSNFGKWYINKKKEMKGNIPIKFAKWIYSEITK